MSVPGQPPADPAAVARAILGTITAWWAAHAADPNPPEALPARQFVAPGAPREVAWDPQGQLHVALDHILAGLNPMQPPQPAQLPRSGQAGSPGALNRSALFEVQIVRCQPSLTAAGRIPTRDTLDAQGATLVADAGHLSRAAIAGAKAGDWLREGVHGQITVGDVTTVGPQGELAAIALALTIPLL